VIELKGINRLNPETLKVVPPSPVSEIEVDSLTPATVIWGRLLKKHPEIISIDIAHYPSQAHGTSDRYWTHTIPAMVAEQTLTKGLVPNANERLEDAFAISSLVGVSVSKDPIDDREGYYALWIEGGSKYPEAYRAFVTLDLETQANDRTLRSILNPLSHIDCNWYLLQSGASYHLILDDLVSPKELINNWAGLINLLNPTPSWEESLGHLNFFRRYDIGDALRQAGNDVVSLRRLVQELLPEFGHIDQPDKLKQTRLVDVRWVLHSIGEICDLLEGRNTSAAFLRISGSKRYESPPLLTAEKDNLGLKVYRPKSNVFMSKQAEFPFDCDTCVL